ncbi:MAG TPA: hypothetical protein VFJ17_15130 [Mycobacteriales bacterium]|jgi:hypothetical protein|nr:hypothetical protein [Mycobacteriales bacterium]
MSIEDQPTQQIHRPTTPPAPLPGPLSPANPQPATPTDETFDSGSTEVLSLEEIFDRQTTTQAPQRPVEQPPTARVTAAPVAPAPVTAPVAAPRIGAVPVRSAQSTGESRNRVLGDAAQAWRGGLDRSRTWLTSGDNAVIAATVLIAVLLLLAIGLF